MTATTGASRLGWAAIVAAAIGLLGASSARAEAEARPRPLVQVAMLLDTSNSMDGLINQARTHLWAIVNQLARAGKGGEPPVLEVALLEYGNNGLSAESGYIRIVTDLTDDLDLISERLFSLTTNGGDEYCGQVIERAVKNLGWAEGDHYKAIFIAGNEPFTQGPVAHTESCRAAIAHGIVVNTIHCGAEADGRAGRWDEGARLADGRFMNIDQDAAELAIAAPQDERLGELSRSLNATYIPYGSGGVLMKKRQATQDANAAGAAPEAMVQRAAAKSSKLYRNAAWDLLDALEEGEVELDGIDERELPEEMRAMSPEEREAFVAAKRAERREVAAEIQRLGEERERFVAAERARLTEGGADTFQSAIEAMLREQLAKKGYTLGR